MSDTDRIEKTVLLKASRARVWRALSDAAEFGAWFGVRMEGAFAEGTTARGRITHPGYEHLTMEIQIQRMDPERYLSFRWHPHAVDATLDYSTEPTTLVEFSLSEAPGATLVTIVESGFDQVPLHRRTEAFRMNDAGWAAQARNLAHHVEDS